MKPPRLDMQGATAISNTDLIATSDPKRPISIRIFYGKSKIEFECKAKVSTVTGRSIRPWVKWACKKDPEGLG